ncbi:uncharacterized protein LOC101857659 [Aplysia californica]|uniref:Uncharacterized protein LOC101857659 n=1 Tax=Aplysia californica TaxID=6500 RepID=A0ABM1A4Q6_APLCA|nr:uncharacterized protein LOC101857659 [Aplysia californica]XP_012940803.1 uncharacterized protein LOC101857659 [Aplysia californica]
MSQEHSALEGSKSNLATTQDWPSIQDECSEDSRVISNTSSEAVRGVQVQTVKEKKLFQGPSSHVKEKQNVKDICNQGFFLAKQSPFLSSVPSVFQVKFGFVKKNDGRHGTEVKNILFGSDENSKAPLQQKHTNMEPGKRSRDTDSFDVDRELEMKKCYPADQQMEREDREVMSLVKKEPMEESPDLISEQPSLHHVASCRGGHGPIKDINRRPSEPFGDNSQLSAVSCKANESSPRLHSSPKSSSGSLSSMDFCQEQPDSSTGTCEQLKEKNECVVLCQVCDDLAAGFYCGAYICEACKKFFIRASKLECPRYVCLRQKNCIITKESRVHCQFCRYQKCLQLNMRYAKEGLKGSGKAGVQEIPCRVCSAPSSGFHFGALTCEGCKGFFRRMVKEREACAYKCSKDGNCEVNAMTRNMCKACRYHKCLQIGMSVEGSRIGRQPNAVKHAISIEAKKLVALKTEPGTNSGDNSSNFNFDSVMLDPYSQSDVDENLPSLQISQESSSYDVSPSSLSSHGSEGRMQQKSVSVFTGSKVRDEPHMRDQDSRSAYFTDSSSNTSDSRSQNAPQESTTLPLYTEEKVPSAFYGKRSASEMSSTGPYQTMPGSYNEQEESLDLSFSSSFQKKLSTTHNVDPSVSPHRVSPFQKPVLTHPDSRMTSLCDQRLRSASFDLRGAATSYDLHVQPSSEFRSMSGNGDMDLQFPHSQTSPYGSPSPSLSRPCRYTPRPCDYRVMPQSSPHSHMNSESPLPTMPPTQGHPQYFEPQRSPFSAPDVQLNDASGHHHHHQTHQILIPPSQRSPSPYVDNAADHQKVFSREPENAETSWQFRAISTSPSPKCVDGWSHRVGRRGSSSSQGTRSLTPSPARSGTSMKTPVPTSGRQSANLEKEQRVQEQSPVAGARESPSLSRKLETPVSIDSVTAEDAKKSMSLGAVELTHICMLDRAKSDIYEPELFKDVESGWDRSMEHFDFHAKCIVRFAKKICGFRSLDINDQVLLLRMATYSLVLLNHSRGYDVATGFYTYFNFTKKEQTRLRELFPDFEVLHSHFAHAGIVAKCLGITDMEYAYLSCLLLLNDELPDLAKAEEVKELRVRFMGSFQDYEIDNFPNGSLRFGEMMLRLTEYYQFSMQHNTAVGNILSKHPHLAVPQLYAEMYAS